MATPSEGAAGSPAPAAASRRGGAVSFHRSLLTNLATAVVLLGGTIMALTFLSSERGVRHLSAIVLDQAIGRVELQLETVFAPPARQLRLLEGWGRAGLLPLDDAAAMNRFLVPLLQVAPYLSAVMVADERGRDHSLFHLETGWRSRHMVRDLRNDRAAVAEWSEGQPVPAAAWKDLDYDPRRRPWYRGAIDVARSRAAPDAAPTVGVYWTEPYEFFTAGAPGITAALAFRARDGLVHVAGIDLLLADISKFTTGLRPGGDGKVVVLAADGRVIGLPSDRRFVGAEARTAAVLKRPEELGLPVVAEAVRRLAPRSTTRPLRFTAQDEPWWAAVKPFRLGSERRLSMVVMVPEANLVGDVRRIRLGTLALMLVGLGAAIARATWLARRYSRPIEALAHASERISRGDLTPGPPIVSPIAEITQLVDAHERMRSGLSTLLKLEGDLQLARRIQQDTFPTELPAPPGFEIDAWNEAAEETGGDTYDVIGYARAPGQRAPRLDEAGADRAMLLVADATGHGIGPALSVTEVRAMLRMAVRAGQDLPAIVEHLNAQLCADLSEGRFVSAWLGELDGREATLRSYSCGQGPVLHFRAAEGACDLLETDAPPLGLVDDLAVRVREPIVLRPGDVFVVASDGIAEATDAEDHLFGTQRLIDVVARHHDASAAGLLQALRSALAAFTGAAPADDDRTILIVKRTA